MHEEVINEGPTGQRTLVVGNVDVGLLRHQRDALLHVIDNASDNPDLKKHVLHLDGLTHLLDYMLDQAVDDPEGPAVYLVRWDHKNGDTVTAHATRRGAEVTEERTMLNSLKGWLRIDELDKVIEAGTLPGSFSDLTGHNEFVTIEKVLLND